MLLVYVQMHEIIIYGSISPISFLRCLRHTFLPITLKSEQHVTSLGSVSQLYDTTHAEAVYRAREFL